MHLRELVDELELVVKCGRQHLEVEVNRGYASDLMSDVIANACEGDLWITLQIHLNIVAVASMRDLCGIVLINGRDPEATTTEKAESEGMPILVSQLPAFELIGRLYELGVSGI